MAIAFGAIASAIDASGNYTSISVAGSNTIGFVQSVGDVNADNVTGITWGGVAMTKIASGIPGTDRATGLWFIVNPASASAIITTGGTFKGALEYYFTGAKQSGQPDSSNSGGNTSASSIALTTTVVAEDSFTTMVHKHGGSSNYTTDVGSEENDDSPNGTYVSQSNATVSTGNNTTTHTRDSGTSDHFGIIASIAPAVAGAEPAIFFGSNF